MGFLDALCRGTDKVTQPVEPFEGNIDFYEEEPHTGGARSSRRKTHRARRVARYDTRKQRRRA